MNWRRITRHSSLPKASTSALTARWLAYPSFTQTTAGAWLFSSCRRPVASPPAADNSGRSAAHRWMPESEESFDYVSRCLPDPLWVLAHTRDHGSGGQVEVHRPRWGNQIDLQVVYREDAGIHRFNIWNSPSCVVGGSPTPERERLSPDVSRHCRRVGNGAA